jgi:hypothetical protein
MIAQSNPSHQGKQETDAVRNCNILLKRITGYPVLGLRNTIHKYVEKDSMIFSKITLQHFPNCL